MAHGSHLGRRGLLAAGLAGGAALALPGAAAALVPTPRQTPGPFYPQRLPLDHDADLTRVAGQARAAEGVPTQVFGRLLTEDGRPITDALVEIWQCDAKGRYHHPMDRGGRADPAFQGYGQTAVGADGGYRFRTIRPAPYPGRTPHIHFAVSGPGLERLTTQMYVEGDPGNARDVLLSRIRDPEARASVLVPFERDPALEPEGFVARFDIVLGRNLLKG